jgi:HPt (histidine-containing phosphotransfer) domain-containing protein
VALNFRGKVPFAQAMSTTAFSVEPAHVRTSLGGDAPVVDLSPLHEMGDPALTVEIAQLFIDSTVPLLTAIREAMARADAGAIARAAHSVKGASANMYAGRLQTASAALEAAAKRSELAAMLTLTEEVERHFQEATAYLRSELSLT